MSIKTIALVTGATGGIGTEFVRELSREPLDEIWVIGRDAKQLGALQAEFGSRVRPIRIDLTTQLADLNDLLQQQTPVVSYLIHNAGIAKMQPSQDFTAEEIQQTICLNCTVPVLLTNICIPYMKSGSRILYLSSASAFQPVPYLNLYASTKVFERHYSRALHVELAQLGITSTAVCPSWVDTDLLTRELNGRRVKFHGMVRPESVVKKALQDAKQGKDMSICSPYVRCQHATVKLLPQTWTMKLWMREIRKYL